MTKRPSLAESMKAVERVPAPAQAPAAAVESTSPPPRVVSAEASKPYRAATREGLKKVTTGVEPEKKKQLKRLSVEQDKSVEDLLREAIDDLLAKYK